MKKRSLVSAVAMLVVSAIMLTSATYAWFSTGGPAKIGTLQGMTAQAGSGVFVKTLRAADDWATRLGYKDLAADTTNNYFVTRWENASHELGNPGETGVSNVAPTLAGYHPDGTYHPVSADPSTFLSSGTFVADVNAKFYCYTLDNRKFSPYTATGTEPEKVTFYDHYDFLVGAASEDTTADAASLNDTNVDVKLEITGNAAKAARVAVFACPNYNNGGTWQYVGTFSGSVEQDEEWYPIKAALANEAEDANLNYIVDEGDNDDTASPAIDITTGKLTDSAVTVTAAPTATVNGNRSFQLTDVHMKGGYTYKNASNQNVTVSNTRVRAYVWLEGQDIDCAPGKNVDGADIQVTWKFVANPLNDAQIGDSITDGAQDWNIS